MAERDGHVRLLPIRVANKIAAGEVVERPASVVKELVENSIDAGAKSIRIAVTQGGRKLVSVQDDGSGMSRDDAVLSLERQATSKILDVDDIESITTLGFRGEAIPSIASVSRFSMTTRRRDSDEGVFIQVNAGELAEVRAAGCPPGTLVEVRDLFCNVPARRKFLRAYATEEGHIRYVFTVHALAYPAIGFSLTIDGREAYRLAPSASSAERMRELFGEDFSEQMLPVDFKGASRSGEIAVKGFIERPNLSSPTRREQYVFVNRRPATAPSIAYALREAYPRRQGDARPAAVLFIDLPPNQVDVNVHPMKREVRFRDNASVRESIIAAIGEALKGGGAAGAGSAAISVGVNGNSSVGGACGAAISVGAGGMNGGPVGANSGLSGLSGNSGVAVDIPSPQPPSPLPSPSPQPTPSSSPLPPPPPSAAPVQVEFAVDPSSNATRPWRWFKFLAATESGYFLVETDAGIVTVNPQAARERIAFEALFRSAGPVASQALLIPDVVKLSPTDAARIRASLADMASLGFAIEEFGRDTFKVDAVPQIALGAKPADILSTIAADMAEAGQRRGGERWRAEMVAKSVARAFAGASGALTPEGATRLVEELASCRMPYVCPRGKVTMIFTSNRELARKFARE